MQERIKVIKETLALLTKRKCKYRQDNIKNNAKGDNLPHRGCEDCVYTWVEAFPKCAITRLYTEEFQNRQAAADYEEFMGRGEE